MLEMKLQDNELKVWVAPTVFDRRPLAEGDLHKDRYKAPGGRESLVIHPALVFGPDLAVARAPKAEKPGSSHILVSRGEEPSLRQLELERIPVKLSKRKEINQRIIEVSNAISPENSAPPAFFVAQDPNSAMATTAGINVT
jgi:hypothetical protein